MQTRNNPIVSAARLCLAAIVLGMACVPMQSVSARPHAQDFVVNPAAEQYLLSGLIANGYADLADAFPDESQRVVGADFFIGALNHPDVQSKQNIYIGNTVIVGYVNALAARIPYTLFLNVVTFTDYVNFSDSEINSLTVFDASFYQGVEFQGISAKELDLRNDIFYYGINLYGVEIGELTFVENQVLGTEPMREGIAFPSEFRRMNVSSVADFSGTYFEGAAVFEESEFHTLLMWNMQFAGEADFRKVLVERTGEFVGAEFLQGADFTESSLGSASFEGARFAGAVFFTGCSVNGDLNFDGATFSASGPPADLSHMDVADTTWLNDIYTAAGLDLSYGSFKNLRISAGTGSAIPSLLLVEAEISGQFAIKDSQIGDLNVSGMKNDGTATLDNVAITEALDLQNAHLNLLVVNGLTWPESPESFNLRGMTFSDIDLGEQGLTEETWRELLRLVNTSVYSPQTYKAISQFFLDKGYPEWAAEVELAGKRRERDEVLTPFTGRWLWSWFLDIFSGYGYRPFLAFIWSAVVVGFGAFVYRRKEDMLPVEQADAPVEYNPFWYSFALFLPYIDLGIQGKWEPKPERKWARHYKYIHLLLGWVLMPIALLAFGGVLR